MEDTENLREVGFDDGAVVEIITHLALNISTNCINAASEGLVYFPKVALASLEGL